MLKESVNKNHYRPIIRAKGDNVDANRQKIDNTQNLIKQISRINGLTDDNGRHK